MGRNVRIYFRSGAELATPTGDRTRLRSAGRRVGCQITPSEVDYKATPAEAERIVSAWREMAQIELNTDRVLKHVAALQRWNNGLKRTRGREALWL